MPVSRANDLAPVVDGGRAGRARQRHPDRLADRGHRVRGVHAGARAGGGARRALDRRAAPRRRSMPFACAPDRLEDVLDRDVRALVGARGGSCRRRGRPTAGSSAPSPSASPARTCRSPRCRRARPSARRASRARPSPRSGRGSSATPSCPRGPSRCRRDTAIVVNSIGTAPALTHALLRERGELVEVVVAGRDLVPARRDAHLRLAEVVLAKPDRAQHRAGRSALGSLRDLPAARDGPCPAAVLTSCLVGSDGLEASPRYQPGGDRPTAWTIPWAGHDRPRHPRSRPTPAAAGGSARRSPPEFAGEPGAAARPSDTNADVVILGGGYTGMWTAWST